MEKKYDALRALHGRLTATVAAYEKALGELDGFTAKSAVDDLVARRKSNIAQIETFLKSADIDPSDLPEPDRLYSAVEWTAATQSGETGVTEQIESYERDVLSAYDLAVVPLTGDDRELGFLTDQYEHLKSVLREIKASESA